jgi:hypothetical protein
METYIDIYHCADGEKASIIHKKLVDLGLKPTIGEHDFIFNWKRVVSMDEEIQFIDKIQSSLKGTGAFLRFTTMR